MKKTHAAVGWALCLALLLVGCSAKEGTSTGIELSEFVANVNAQVTTPLTLPEDSAKKTNKLGYYWLMVPSEGVTVSVVNYKKSGSVYYYSVVVRSGYKDDAASWKQFQEYVRAGVALSLPADQAQGVLDQLKISSATRAEATAAAKQLQARVGECSYYLHDYTDNANGQLFFEYEYDNSLNKSTNKSTNKNQPQELG